MDQDARPVIVAFDGSAEAVEAVRAAATLFGDRELVVVSVWEPSLGLTPVAFPDATGVSLPPPSPEDVAVLDEMQREHAESTAEAGVRLARELGVSAEAVPVADRADIASMVLGQAEQRDAAAIVVGSRGRGALRSKVLGSTSRRLVHDARRPVLVVRPPG